MVCVAEPELRNPMPQGECKRLFWLAPVYNEDNDHVLLEIKPEERNLLESAFREALPISGIDPWLLDGKPVDSGYLIFDFGDEWFCVHVYPYTNKPRSVNVSTIKELKFGRVIIEDVSIEDGLETTVDYRTILKGIGRPEVLGNTALFKVEKKIAKRLR